MKRYKQTLIIQGSPRSGTTWLAEIINQTQQYRYIFEPFHARESTEWIGLGWAAYISAEELSISDKKVRSLHKILKGKISSKNTWALGHGEQHGGANRLMIKAVRAQYLLGAIKSIKPNTKFVFIIRDPVSTVISQLKSGFPCPALAMFGSKPLEKYNELIESCFKKYGESDEVRIVMRWAVETKTLTDFNLENKSQCLLISYNELKLHRKNVVGKLVKFLELDSAVDDLVSKSKVKSVTTELSNKKNIKKTTRDNITKLAPLIAHDFDLDEHLL